MLKVMSKMGISDVASYCGAQIFEAIGLAREVVDRASRDAVPDRRDRLRRARARGARARHAVAYAEEPQLENPGYVKFRKGGEPHATNPDVVDALHETAAAHALRKAVNGGGWRLYERFAGLVNGRSPLELRDLLELGRGGPAGPARRGRAG